MLKFSIIIPLYNKSAHIQRAIDSVLRQTVSDFECIVIDDGSTDGGGDVVRKIQDNRIKLVTQTNAGVSAARNKGIYLAQSEYIAFLDADDTWEPDFLSTISELIHSFPEAGAFVTAHKDILMNGKEKSLAFNVLDKGQVMGIIPNYLKANTKQNIIWTGAVCIPKKVFRVTGGFNELMRLYEDFDLWIRISFKYPIAFHSRVCSTYHRNIQNNAYSFYLPEKDDLAIDLLSSNIEKNKSISNENRKYLEINISNLYYLNALLCLSKNNSNYARKLIKKIQPITFTLFRRKILLLIISFLPDFFFKYIKKVSVSLKTLKLKI